MILVACLASALAAAPLRVQVEPDEVVRGPRPVESSSRQVVPITPVDVRVDGRREGAWDEVRPGPPLDALLQGPQPPLQTIRVARARGELVVLHPRMEPGWRAGLVFDVDGTATSWTVVHLGEGVRFERCSLAEVALPAPFPLPHRAAPCVPVEGRFASGEDVVEVALSTTGWTGAARLLWTVWGPHGAGGTWARSGQSALVPEQGRWLDLGRPGFRASVSADLASKALQVQVLSMRTSEALVWRLGGQGRVVSEGTLASDGRIVLPWPEQAEPWLEIRQVSGDPPASRVVRLPWGRPRAWPVQRTPEAWVLRYEAPSALATSVTVTDRRGRIVGRADVELPRGHGRLTLSQLPRGGRFLTLEGLYESDLDLEQWPLVADPASVVAR